MIHASSQLDIRNLNIYLMLNEKKMEPNTAKKWRRRRRKSTIHLIKIDENHNRFYCKCVVYQNQRLNERMREPSRAVCVCFFIERIMSTARNGYLKRKKCVAEPFNSVHLIQFLYKYTHWNRYHSPFIRMTAGLRHDHSAQLINYSGVCVKLHMRMCKLNDYICTLSAHWASLHLLNGAKKPNIDKIDLKS